MAPPIVPDEKTVHYYASELPIREIYGWAYQLFRGLPRELRVDNKDRVRRWLAIKSENDFRRVLLSEAPSTVHLGSIHRDKSPLMSPLKIDVDLSDYERICCGHEKITCPSCWKDFAQEDIPLLHARLLCFFRDDEITWVFSGQKGYHCWIHAPRAYMMTSEERSTWLFGLIAFMQTKGRKWIPDQNVTRDLIHTLRLPLTLNKGNVAIPFDPLHIPCLDALQCKPHDTVRIRASLPYLRIRNPQA